VDSVEAAVGSEIEAELLEATGGEGAVVGGCDVVAVEITQDFADSICIVGVFLVVGTVSFNYFF
jgi:hypothetical protein